MPASFSRPRRKFDAVIVDTIENHVYPVLRKESNDYARAIREEIVRRITEQDFDPGLEPLAQSTIDKKGDDRLLIDTGQYIEALQVTETDTGPIVGFGNATHHEEWQKMVKPPRKTKKGKEIPAEYVKITRERPMQEISDMLEYGTSRMPARPHIRPVVAKVQREQGFVKEKWTKAMQRAVDDAMEAHNNDMVTEGEDAE